MNYLRELNAFRDWTLLSRPSTGQVALWHSLMSVNNMSGWIDWFTVPNQTLQLMTGLSRQGLDRTRLALINETLIEYRKGSSNQAGKYHMISLECKKVGTAVVTNRASEWSQTGHDSGTLVKQDKTKTEREIACAEIVQAYEQTCGPLRGEPSQLNTLLEYIETGMETRLVIHAIHKSSTADYPAKYADTILRGYQRKGVKTLDEAKMEEGKNGGNAQHPRPLQSARAANGRTKRIVPEGTYGRV